MVRKYAIILKSQLGPKTGALRIRDSGSQMFCVLELLGHKSLLIGKPIGSSCFFDLCGTIWTPLGKADCMIAGIRGKESISGKITISGKIYEITGSELL
jgi:hypothetical protein